MNLTSVNLNKRFNSPATRARLADWLQSHAAEVVLMQEPWRAGSTPELRVNDYVPIAGNHRVFAWRRSDIRLAIDAEGEIAPDAVFERLKIGRLAVYNVHLSAYAQRERAAQLTDLHRAVSTEQDQPIVIVGDFNLAPRSEDGLADGKPSKFNSEVDRAPLRSLLDSAALLDLGAMQEAKQWTLERNIGRKRKDPFDPVQPPVLSQFRCDLALVSRDIAPDVELRYDHSTRLAPSSFTDHSALILTVPF